MITMLIELLQRYFWRCAGNLLFMIRCTIFYRC